MKKTLLLTLLTPLIATSCMDDDSNYSGANSYHFATVMEVGVDPATDSGSDDDSSDEDENLNAEVYFMLDSKESIMVSENLSRTELDELKAGDRLIIGVTLSKSLDANYDYSALLYEVVDVVMGESATVDNQEQSEAIADHKFEYVATNISLTYGYLNLYAGVANDDKDIKFYLVENNHDEPEETKDNYLNLELRYDCGGEEGEGSVEEHYISFDMESYRDRLEGKKGIILRLKTEKSGTVSALVFSKSLYPSDEE